MIDALYIDILKDERVKVFKSENNQVVQDAATKAHTKEKSRAVSMP
jgi:hypothetical protein